MRKIAFQFIIKEFIKMKIYLEWICFIISGLHGFAPVQVIKLKMKSRSGFVPRRISQECYLVRFIKSEQDNLKKLEKGSILSDVHVTYEHLINSDGINMNPTRYYQCQKCGPNIATWMQNTRFVVVLPTPKKNCPMKEETKNQPTKIQMYKLWG